MGISEGIVWVVVGGIICVLALQYDLGSFRAPGPGFVSFLAGIFVAAIGAIMVVSKRVSGPPKEAALPSGQGIAVASRSRLLYTMVLLVAYAILMIPLGYIASTFLVMFGLFFDWEKKNWLWGFIFPITVSLGSYLVFEIWLQCQLPRGILPWW